MRILPAIPHILPIYTRHPRNQCSGMIRKSGERFFARQTRKCVCAGIMPKKRKHDPKKWERFFARQTRECVCAGIILESLIGTKPCGAYSGEKAKRGSAQGRATEKPKRSSHRCNRMSSYAPATSRAASAVSTSRRQSIVTNPGTCSTRLSQARTAGKVDRS